MSQQPKNACVLFRTIVEAAKEMDKEEALEMLFAYADYAMGDTEDIETDNKYIKLILKQLVPALSAAEKRYEAACENGPKGKEYGKKGGRPRKGETKEQAYERRNGSTIPSKTPEQSPVETPEDEKMIKAHNLARNYKTDDAEHNRGESTLTQSWILNNILTGQKCVYCGESDWHLLGCDRIDNSKPHTPDNVVCSCSKCNIERGNMNYHDFLKKKSPVKPLDVEEEVDTEVEEEKDVYTEESKEKEIEYSYEDFSNNLKNMCISFVRKHNDYNYFLDEEDFLDYYYDNIVRFQLYVNEKLHANITIKDCVLLILGHAQEYQEGTQPA